MGHTNIPIPEYVHVFLILLILADLFVTSVFNIPCALAKNIQTLLICRFFCGIFASGPLTLAGSTISDIWDNNERGFAIALFAAAPYGGAALGPLVGVSLTLPYPYDGER